MFCQESWNLDKDRGVVAQRNYTPSGDRLTSQLSCHVQEDIRNYLPAYDVLLAN